MTDYLIGARPENFSLVELDQALNLGLVSWAFSTSDAILGLWFSFQCLEEKLSS